MRSANPTLTEEIHTLDEVLTELEKHREKSLVLDTTGSVIHAGNNLLMRLRRQMTIVVLGGDSTRTAALDQKIFERPQAGIVARRVSTEARESPRETAARCYPALTPRAARAMKRLRTAPCKSPRCAMVRWMPRVSGNDSQQDRSRPMSQIR